MGWTGNDPWDLVVESSFAPRPGLSIFARHPEPEELWRKAVEAIDWNRVLLQARGRHMAPIQDRGHETAHSYNSYGEEICGLCIKAVLLELDE